ncbi:hypothetical protein ACLB1S_26790 [Escherichia coli]
MASGIGRTIQQGFEAAKNIGTQPVAAQVAAAPAADVAEQPQPQTADGVASPAQASVSDLTGAVRTASACKHPGSNHHSGKRASESIRRTENLRYLITTT